MCSWSVCPFTSVLLVFSYAAILWPEYLSLYSSSPKDISLTLFASSSDHCLISHVTHEC